MEIKTTVRYLFIHTKMAKVRWFISAAKVMEKLESSYTAGRNGIWCSHFGKWSGNFSKGYTDLPYDPASLLLGICHSSLKTYAHMRT